MTPSRPGAQRRVKIVNQAGLHARSAAGLARIASGARGAIWLARESLRADATDIMDMLALACGPGTEITLEAEDAADAVVLEQMAALIENGFGETGK